MQKHSIVYLCHRALIDICSHSHAEEPNIYIVQLHLKPNAKALKAHLNALYLFIAQSHCIVLYIVIIALHIDVILCITIHHYKTKHWIKKIRRNMTASNNDVLNPFECGMLL